MTDNLHGFWKPDKQTREALRLDKPKKRRKRYKPRNRVKGNSRKAKICNLPSSEFYDTKQWKMLRFKVLAMYGRKCMRCDAVDVEMHVDHIKPRSKYPGLSLAIRNLQVLCKFCNEEKSNLHSTDYREESIARDLDRETWLAAIDRI